jgi:hypothetical protein
VERRIDENCSGDFPRFEKRFAARSVDTRVTHYLWNLFAAVAAQRKNFAILDVAPAEMDRSGGTTDFNAESVPEKLLRREHGGFGIADGYKIMLLDRAAFDALRRHNPSATVIMGLFHISIEIGCCRNIGCGSRYKTAVIRSASGR